MPHQKKIQSDPADVLIQPRKKSWQENDPLDLFPTKNDMSLLEINPANITYYLLRS
jgi:hypothetical protein